MEKNKTEVAWLLLGAMAVLVVLAVVVFFWKFQTESPASKQMSTSPMKVVETNSVAPLKSVVAEDGVVRESGVTFTFAESASGRPPVVTEAEFLAKQRSQRSQ